MGNLCFKPIVSEIINLEEIVDQIIEDTLLPAIKDTLGSIVEDTLPTIEDTLLPAIKDTLGSLVEQVV